MNKMRLYISLMGGICIFSLFSCTKEKKVDIGDHFFVPNSFSPNNDQVNDFFYLIPRVPISAYHISIYNENIQLVFETEDINGLWNGYSGSTGPVSGYYEYQVVYTASEDSVHYEDYIASSKIYLLQ